MLLIFIIFIIIEFNTQNFDKGIGCHKIFICLKTIIHNSQFTIHNSQFKHNSQFTIHNSQLILIFNHE